MIGSTASTSTHRSVASPCISSTKLRSPHTSCLVSTHTAWSQLPPPLLLFGLCIAGAPHALHAPPFAAGSWSGQRSATPFPFWMSSCFAVPDTALSCDADSKSSRLRDVGCRRRLWNLARADLSEEFRTPVFSLAPVCRARSRRTEMTSNNSWGATHHLEGVRCSVWPDPNEPHVTS